VITGSGPRTGQARPGQRAPGWLAREIRALFAEARRRRRRRRLVVAAAVLGVAALAGAAVAGSVAAGGRHGPAAAGASRPAQVPGPRFALPPAVVAWFDANAALRIGNVATLAQRRVAQVPGDPPCCRLVLAGERIYWAGRVANRDYIQDYDLAAGTVRNAAPGDAVFAAPGGRSVYIAQSPRRLLELPAGGMGPARRLTTPPGWRLVPLGWAVAGGIALSGGHAGHPAIGVWQPRTGRIRVIGHGDVLATWTRPAGGRSLIAWQPAARCPLQHCPIEITSTPAGRTLTVRSPFRYGFLPQGGDAAFSPDGTQLAGFISLNRLSSYGAAVFVPVIVNTSTGTVRLARRAIMSNGELAGWLLWLPGGTRLLAGPARDISRYAGYAIDAQTAAARPFSFFPQNADYPANAASDIGYGAVLVPRTAIKDGSRTHAPL
jgi:hypothetical protein